MPEKDQQRSLCGVTADPREKGVFHLAPTHPHCSPSRIKNSPSFALRRKVAADFNQMSEITIICTKLISFAFKIRRAAADSRHGKQRRPSPGPQPRPPWQRALTGTLSGYFFRIFSPSFFLYSNGWSSLYWNFMAPGRPSARGCCCGCCGCCCCGCGCLRPDRRCAKSSARPAPPPGAARRARASAASREPPRHRAVWRVGRAPRRPHRGVTSRGAAPRAEPWRHGEAPRCPGRREVGGQGGARRFPARRVLFVHWFIARQYVNKQIF